MRAVFVSLCVVFFACAFFPRAAHSQLRVDVEEVYIVVDARLPNGDPINGLTASDFTVTQNGAVVPIRGMEIQNKDVPREGPIDVALVLCNKGCLTLDKLVQATSKLLTLFQKEDRVALYLMCPDPHQIAGFTSDMKELQKALVGVTIMNTCQPRLADMATMATNDIVALKEMKDLHRRVMPVIAGDPLPFGTKKGECYSDDEDGTQTTYACDVPEYNGPEFDRVVRMLLESEIKFFDISHENNPQKQIAEATAGQSINVESLAGGDASPATVALKELRMRNITGHRYTIMFTPVVIGELGNISVSLSPRFGTLGRDYGLIVQKPVVRTR